MVRNALLERARRRLRAIQERFATLVKQPPTDQPNCFRKILELQYEREKGALIKDGRLRLPGSPFTFPEGPEHRRFERTKELTQRARPGPNEHPDIFAVLARQATTIELCIEDQQHGLGKARHGFKPAVLLGTILFSTARSVPLLSCEPDNAILLLNTTFIDFVYQLIKLTVLSWQLQSANNVTPARFDGRVEKALATLAAKPSLKEDCLELLLSYCTSSVPRTRMGRRRCRINCRCLCWSTLPSGS